MGDKQRKRDLVTAFLREVVPPAGVEVQVYRRCLDDREKWEYLGWLELGVEIGLDDLEAKSVGDLECLIPFPKTRQRWGGGDYQFRFIWRDDEGRREQKRSQNGSIAGDPLPRC